MKCPCCGMPVKDGAAFCPSCGTNMNISGGVSPSMPIPAKYKPLSSWSYVGYGILFSIPVIGLICLIVFSLNESNINRRNYARSFWCALLIVVLLFIAVYVFSAVNGTANQLIRELQNAFLKG